MRLLEVSCHQYAVFFQPWLGVGWDQHPRGEITGDYLETWLPPDGCEHSCSQEIVKTCFGRRTFPLTLQATHRLPQVILPSFWWYECGSRGPGLRVVVHQSWETQKAGLSSKFKFAWWILDTWIFERGSLSFPIRLGIPMSISASLKTVRRRFGSSSGSRLSQWVGVATGSLLPIDNKVPAIATFSSVQLLSHVWLFATPWTTACQASLFITNSRSLLKCTSIESVMPSNHPILCHPLLLLPSIFPSIRVFSNESALHIRWPKYWSFSFNISPSNEQPGLVSFRMDWLDLPVVQGTLKSLLQHHNSKASILWCSTFFIVQLSHPYMTTGETVTLTRRTFVGKVMSLLYNMLSRLVITFLPRSKCLLISLLQSPSAVILEPKKIKSATVCTVSPYICHEVMGPDAMILACFLRWAECFLNVEL